jgi:RNA polymerase sigma-70 factor, ECF subfamily
MGYAMQNIDALIDRCRAGDERATEALYNNHQGQVFRLAYGILGNWEDAQEATQDALVYAITKINHYDPRKARFSTWLHTITVSRCRNKRRGRRFSWLSLTAWLEGRGGDVVDAKPGQEAEVIREELCDEVWLAIQNLSPFLREAIVLRHWGELTYREMAEVLGCPIRTAQSRVRLAYESLQTALSQESLADYVGTLEKEQPS